MDNKNIILLHHHLGLGDHLICNGLVRFINEQIKPDILYLPTKKNNIFTVKKMYHDESKIVPLEVNNDQDVYSLPEIKQCNKIISIGFHKTRDDWDVSFYETNGIPFDIRWKYFKINRNVKRENTIKNKLGLKNEPFILIHNEGSDCKFDLKIDNNIKKIFVTPLTDCLLDWCGLIEEAQEVHCIDSSFIHLAQSLNVKSGIFHNIRKANGIFKLKNSWKLILY
jgi:hypothetical protein